MNSSKPKDPDASPAASQSSNAEELLAALKAHFPNGFSVDAAGKVTAAGKSQKVTSLADFGELIRAPKRLQIPIGEALYDFELRGLTSEEDAKTDELMNEVGQPPAKYKTEAGKRIPDGYDYSDKEYLARRLAALRRKRAMTLSFGLVGLEIPGATLEEKTAWLEKNFPPRVLDALHGGIANLTTEPIERATFI